jgi:two-component system sensor histidine kinase/response regulator
MKTILLVDDEKQLRSMFALALERHGYRVFQADSGATGFELARQQLPDLILTDINMPGGDGATLLRNIRQDPELKARQVVLMTGRPDLVPPRRAMEEGADDFLLKPVSLAALISCVEARFRRASISWRVEDEMLSQLRSSMPPQLPHELFTPLAGIIGLVDILRADFVSMPVSEVADIHNDIYHSALRLHRTLRNYLLILDREPSTSVLSSTPLPPPKAKRSVQEGIDEAMRQNERTADVTAQVDDKCALLISEEDLQRIVSELVDNACKYSRQGTPIDVAVSADGKLTVKDHGRGMTPDEIARIGAFQQFDRKKHEQQGLGLGLILVRKLVEFHGAQLHLTSQPGEGTQAQVTFKT